MKLITVLLLAGCVSAQTVDKSFVVHHGVSLGAAITDARYSYVKIKPENDCHEINPIVRGASQGGYLAATIGTWVGVTTVSYVLKRHHKKWWYLLPDSETAVHLGGVAMTARNCR